MASAVRQGVQRSLASWSRAAVRFCNKTSSPQTSSSGCSTASRFQTCSESNVGSSKGAFSAPRAPNASSSSSSPFTSSSASSFGTRRFASQIARLPGEIGVLQSLMPLYSATANSRLVSRIGTNGDAAILQDDEDGT